MDAVKIIAEPRRREILRLCWHGERAAGDLADAFEITFGAVSQHLKVLRDAGLVTVRRDGTRRYYRANPTALGPLAAYLEAQWGRQLDRLTELAEAAESDSGGTRA
ncbi:MAG TPA: metalloregulator ArsR/SmtB family transcription factor [Actinoplanes sp.]|jgi:DNA-binding transcriptional ArsR family regulator|nr:metalloregulator ArsR/SmtB family transcription factor [Actinoplanes sp.]